MPQAPVPSDASGPIEASGNSSGGAIATELGRAALVIRVGCVSGRFRLTMDPLLDVSGECSAQGVSVRTAAAPEAATGPLRIHLDTPQVWRAEVYTQRA